LVFFGIGGKDWLDEAGPTCCDVRELVNVMYKGKTDFADHCDVVGVEMTESRIVAVRVFGRRCQCFLRD
jgi:hypothetical protein